jgi:hypothetical protein
MDKQAAQVLGEPVIEGVILLESGAAKKMRKNSAGIGGVVGIAVASVVSEIQSRRESDEPELADFSGPGFLALTTSRVVLFSTQSSFLKQKLGDEIASFRAGELDRVVFSKAAAGVGHLDLISTAGMRYSFEFSKVSKKKLVRIAEASQALVIDES